MKKMNKNPLKITGISFILVYLTVLLYRLSK